jgi:uncharacterized protein (TIGR00106 family)
MATAEVSILPSGKPGISTSTYIAEMHRRLEKQDKVRFKLNAMGTELEGTTEDILEVVRWMHQIPFTIGCPRVYTILKLDERADKPDQGLDDKVRSVETEMRKSGSAFRRDRSIF